MIGIEKISSSQFAQVATFVQPSSETPHLLSKMTVEPDRMIEKQQVLQIFAIFADRPPQKQWGP